jgi:hypothetical protein
VSRAPLALRGNLMTFVRFTQRAGSAKVLELRGTRVGPSRSSYRTITPQTRRPVRVTTDLVPSILMRRALRRKYRRFTRVRSWLAPFGSGCGER